MNDSVDFKFNELKNAVDSLHYSNDSIVELIYIKNKACDISLHIEDGNYRKYCLYELNEIESDEFFEMRSIPTESNFSKAKYELSYILNDCANGRQQG